MFETRVASMERPAVDDLVPVSSLERPLPHQHAKDASEWIGGSGRQKVHWRAEGVASK